MSKAQLLVPRNHNVATFPRCETTEEILAVQDACAAAGFRVFSWEQHELALSAPTKDDKGIVVANRKDGEGKRQVFSQKSAAPGAGGRLSFCNDQYELGRSEKELLAADKIFKQELRAAAAHRVAGRGDNPKIGERNITIWRVITHHEIPEEAADWNRREGVVAIGWGDTGDLREQNIRGETDLARLLQDTYGGAVGPGNKAVQGLWRMYREMQIGDLVIVSTGGFRAFTMQVTGDYFFVGDEPPYYEHRRKAVVVAAPPDRLWQFSGGAAQGESIRRSLIRCAHTINQAELAALAP